MDASSLPSPDDNKGPLILALTWTSISLALIVVTLRFYARATIGPKIGGDDICMGVAVTVSLFSSVTNTFQVRNGFGRHIEYLSPAELSGALRWTIAVELSSGFAQLFLRHSICLFLLRLLQGTKKWFRTYIYAVMLLNAVFTIIGLVCYLTQCIPFEGIWNPELHAKCFSKEVLTIVTKMLGGETFTNSMPEEATQLIAKVIGCVIDFACALFPTYVVFYLQMSTRARINLCILLGLGVVTAACSIGNAVTANIQTDDPTYDLVPVELWEMMTVNCGIVVGSVPTLRKLYLITVETTLKQTGRLLSRFSSNRHLLSQGYGNSHHSRMDNQSLEDNVALREYTPDSDKQPVLHTMAASRM